MDTTYLDTIAQFIAGARWETLPADAQRATRRIFLDVLGATMRGSEEPENVKLGDFLRQLSGAERTSTLLRAGFPQVDRLAAAFVNGTQAPSVELDDGYRLATAHSGAYVLPATLALAEAADAPVTAMLAAFAVGYDVASRAALAARGPKFVIMQHGVISVLGSAAAACVLKRHDPATTKETLRIAASFAHITSYDVLREGATVRNLWTGAGARDGLLAAELAPMGYLGLSDAIRVTLERALPTFDAELFVKDLGTMYCVTHNYHKQYACNGNFDAGVEATLRLIAEHGLTPEQIERIVVDIYAPYHTLDAARPRNPLAAKFSLRYAVAAAAALRHADHEAFLPDKLSDPTILGLADRTQLREDAALAANVPRLRPARVTMRLRDGREVSRLVEDPRGHYGNPFSDEELEAKFARLAGRYVSAAGVAAVQDALQQPERAGTAGALTGLLRAHAKA